MSAFGGKADIGRISNSQPLRASEKQSKYVDGGRRGRLKAKKRRPPVRPPAESFENASQYDEVRGVWKGVAPTIVLEER
jgi:hypothetical protein